MTISQPARCAQPSSCSLAAARNVSAAPSSTLRPSSWRRCQASLPIVVVLPVPLTPTARITVGSARRSMRVVADPRRLGQQLDQPLAERLAALELALGASASSAPTTEAVVLAPTSAMISASSRRSQVSSSSSPNSVAWISRRAPGASWPCSRAAAGRRRAYGTVPPDRPQSHPASSAPDGRTVVEDEQVAPLGAPRAGEDISAALNSLRRGQQVDAQGALRPVGPPARLLGEVGRLRAPPAAAARSPSRPRRRPSRRRTASRRPPSCASGG